MIGAFAPNGLRALASGSNPATKICHLAEELQKSDGHGVLLLRGTAPERPSMHHLQDPLETFIEKRSPFEFTIRSAAHRVMGGKPYGHPTFDAFIIAIPHKPWIHAGRDRLPIQSGKGEAFVQKILKQRVWSASHVVLFGGRSLQRVSMGLPLILVIEVGFRSGIHLIRHANTSGRSEAQPEPMVLHRNYGSACGRSVGK